jgi:hypothetical protein
MCPRKWTVLPRADQERPQPDGGAAVALGASTFQVKEQSIWPAIEDARPGSDAYSPPAEGAHTANQGAAHKPAKNLDFL